MCLLFTTINLHPPRGLSRWGRRSWESRQSSGTTKQRNSSSDAPQFLFFVVLLRWSCASFFSKSIRLCSRVSTPTGWRSRGYVPPTTASAAASLPWLPSFHFLHCIPRVVVEWCCCCCSSLPKISRWYIFIFAAERRLSTQNLAIFSTPSQHCVVCVVLVGGWMDTVEWTVWIFSARNNLPTRHDFYSLPESKSSHFQFKQILHHLKISAGLQRVTCWVHWPPIESLYRLTSC